MAEYWICDEPEAGNTCIDTWKGFLKMFERLSREWEDCRLTARELAEKYLIEPETYLKWYGSGALSRLIENVPMSRNARAALRRDLANWVDK